MHHRVRTGPIRQALAAAAVVFASTAAAAQPGGAESPLLAIADAERALARAMHARDRDGMERLLAPDYILRGVPDIDRATWLRNAVTLCWGDRSDIDDFRARQHGGVVVASFVSTFYVDPVRCQPAVLRSLITDVWVRSGGDWRLQVRHSAPPPQAGADVAAQYGIVPELPPVWALSAELSFVGTGGNTSTRTLGLGVEAIHRADAATTRAMVAFLTSQVDDVIRAQSLATHARHGFRVGPRIELFGEGAYARDRFAGVDGRGTAGAGVALTAPLPRSHVVRAEGSLGLAAEQRLDATRLRFATATAAIHYAWTIAPGIELAEDAGLHADLHASDNWRGASTTALRVTLTRLLSLKASLAVEHRNAPVAGFGRTDMRTAAALVFAYERRPAAP